MSSKVLINLEYETETLLEVAAIILYYTKSKIHESFGDIHGDIQVVDKPD